MPLDATEHRATAHRDTEHRDTAHRATAHTAKPSGHDTPGKDPGIARGETILPLHVHNMCYEVGGAALVDRLAFDLTAGPVSVLVGPNGAGKSLTLRLLHGLLTPTAGHVLWNGQPPTRHLRKRQAMVFQKPVLLRRSAAANVDYALRVHGMPRTHRAERTHEILAAAGLDHLERRAARVLSGGEQQRLAIARAWSVRPEVIFLDEPTANLDPSATQTVESMIATIRGQGTKIVMATHDMGQARRLGGDVLFLHRGRLQERTPATTFFEDPKSAAARAYLEGRLLV